MNETDEHTLARLHLKAVLPTVAVLVRQDEKARALVAGQRFGVQLKTRSGLATRLEVLDGNVRVDSPEPGLEALELLFLSDRQLNRTFLGRRFPLPIPTRGFRQLVRLGTFSRLTSRLQHVLATPPSRIDDCRLPELHVNLLVGDLIPAAIADLADNDAPTRHWLEPYGDALIQLGVEGGASSWVRFQCDGAVYDRGAAPGMPDVGIFFRDRHVALAAIHGSLDNLAALGKGEMIIRGLIPLADALQRVLDRLSLLLRRESRN